MGYSVNILGKTVNVDLTAAASRVLSQREIPLLVEMELYFSCLIRKRVNVTDANSRPEAELVTGNLYLQFRPVMTQHCSVDDSGGEPPPLTTFPIKNAAAFVPKWLTLDFRRNKWQGEFGY